ncbi:DRC10 protein, partial [Todus mexicanus]|nr:DRC10 protein [Todus mexicanus]
KGMAPPEKATLMLGASKMLEPCQLKPETEKIIAVLDETIAKLEISSLIPQVIASLDRFADVLGSEITTSLIEHQKLSKEMEEHLLGSSEEGATMRAEEQQGCLSLLEQRLKCSVRSILRLLLVNPSLCRALKSEARVREEPAEGFIKTFGEFRNFMLERLLTSPAEEEEKIQFMEEICLQIMKNTKAIRALQAELAAAIRTQEEEARPVSPRAEPPNLRHEIFCFIRVLFFLLPARGVGREGFVLCSLLRMVLRETRACFPRSSGSPRVRNPATQERKCRVEMEIVNWIQKYDTDMAEKQAEYEEVEAAYEKEKAELSLLMEKHAVLLQEYSQIEEERRIQQQKEEEALKELNTKTAAATRIQAFWRGYLVRSVFKLKKKKKGKGKGKGKGKKAKK